MTTGTAARPRSRRVDPALALRPGRSDAIVLLALWAARRTFVPLLLIGMIAGWLTHQLEPASVEVLSSPGRLLGTVLTPLAGMAVPVSTAASVVLAGVFLLAVAVDPGPHWVDQQPPAQSATAVAPPTAAASDPG